MKTKINHTSACSGSGSGDSGRRKSGRKARRESTGDSRFKADLKIRRGFGLKARRSSAMGDMPVGVRAVVRLSLALAAGALALWLVVSTSTPRKLFDAPYSTLLLSQEGDLLGARIAPDGQWRFPEPDSLPEKFVTCLLEYEDRRFFRHSGVDVRALIRAVSQNMRSGEVVSGGSTLTMQLARQGRGNRPRTVGQKLIEIAWALEIESRLTKREILTLYAANAPFGGNVVGVETAAWRYFGRGVHSLSWAESAMLAVLPNSPALIHPGRNRERLIDKRNSLLLRLMNGGIIDTTEYELACMEPLPDAPHPLPGDAPHLMERLAAEAPGTRIITSIDRDMQLRTQAIVDRHAARNVSNHIHNAAVLVADAQTGEVLAYVGNVSSPGEATHGNFVDIVPAPRSTGSILKPFLYAGMLGEGMILPGTLIPDTPLDIGGYRPENYNKAFSGAVPAHRALERSLNVPLVRMLVRYNTGRFMSLLKACGMTTLRFSEDHYGASLVLGGAEGTLWDITGMYASMARVLTNFPRHNGLYNPADIHPLTLRPAPEADPLNLPTDGRLTSSPVLSAAAIWHTFEAMTDLNRPEEEADWQQFSSMRRIAWKTGTSFGARDAWAVGTTPRYVIGVWVGNASGEGRPGLSGVGYAAPLLFDVLSTLPGGGGWFTPPHDEMEPMAVCRLSGHRASSACDVVDTLLMPAAGIETPVCGYHRVVHLTPDEHFRVNSSCASVADMVTRAWFVLPPVQEYYYRNYNADYRPLPPLKDGCTDLQIRQIDIIYPEHNAVLYLPKGFSGEREHFVFRATHTRRDATIFWHIDDRYVGSTRGNHQIECAPAPGSHLLSLTDSEGNARRIMFEVVE